MPFVGSSFKTFVDTDDITAVQIAAGAVTNSELNVTAITSQTAETTVADDDVILIYDTSASAFRKMTRANFTADLGLTANSADVMMEGLMYG